MRKKQNPKMQKSNLDSRANGEVFRQIEQKEEKIQEIFIACILHRPEVSTEYE